MKRLAFTLALCLAALGVYAVSDLAEINNTLQKKRLQMEATRAPHLGVMWQKYAIGAADIQSVSNVYKYTGAAIQPTPTVKLAGATLTVSTDYAKTYTNNTNVGRAGVIITANRKNLYGSQTKEFRIVERPADELTVTAIANQNYTGSAITPNPTVKIGSVTLTKNTHYTVTYADNIDRSANAKCIITGVAPNIVGTKVVTFTIQ